MNERLDDMIRKRLQGHESEVPEGLFDAISQQPKVQEAFFDNTIRSKLNAAESTVLPHLFETIANVAELEHLGFDSAIRSKTEKVASAVPADMWQRILAEKDRRRRPVGWWWLAAATLLLLAGGGIFYLLNNHLPKQSYSAASRKAAPFRAPGEQTLTDTKDRAGTNEPIIPEVAGNFGKKDDYSKSNLVPDQNARLAWKPFYKSSSPEIHSNTVEDLPISLPTDTKPENADKIPYDSPLSSIQDNNGPGSHLTALSLFRQASRFTPGQLLQAKTHTPVIPCPTNGTDKRNDWHLDVYGSAYLLQKRVQDNYLGKNAKAGFDSTLHQQVSFNAGISLVKNLGENFLLKAGLQYNRINESFRLTQVNERRQVTTISVRTVIISPGDTVYIRDTSVTEKIGTAQYRTQNTYTQWDIPVIIGYAFGGENLHLNANAGIIVNIRSAYQGEMLADSTRKIFDINNYNGQPVYRKTVGFSLYAGLSIVKPLSGKTSLIIEPYTRIGLSNVTNSQAWFNQKNSTMGLSIGLRYKLNGGRQRIY